MEAGDEPDPDILMTYLESKDPFKITPALQNIKYYFNRLDLLPMLPAIIKLTDYFDTTIRERAHELIYLMSTNHQKEILAVLHRYVTDKDVEKINKIGNVYRALDQVDESLIKKVFLLLDGKDQFIRNTAVGVLTEMGPSVVPAILDVLIMGTPTNRASMIAIIRNLDFETRTSSDVLVDLVGIGSLLQSIYLNDNPGYSDIVNLGDKPRLVLYTLPALIHRMNRSKKNIKVRKQGKGRRSLAEAAEEPYMKLVVDHNREVVETLKWEKRKTHFYDQEVKALLGEWLKVIQPCTN